MVEVCQKMNIPLDKSAPFVLFHGGIYSQWHKSQFHAPLTVGEDAGTGPVREWSSAEQFMMANKAALFGDVRVLKLIFKCHNVREVKQLGREVKGFSDKTWNRHKFAIVTDANLHKFRQNKGLLAEVRVAASGKRVSIEWSRLLAVTARLLVALTCHPAAPFVHSSSPPATG
jgi:ribA/ribD-fused uncharacterized protein